MYIFWNRSALSYTFNYTYTEYHYSYTDIHQDIPGHLIYTCVEEGATVEITGPTLHHTLSMVARTVTVISL